MNSEFIQEVREKVRHKPRLTPLFTSTHCIPERLYEYNPRLFICFNNVENSYEIHSLDQEFSFSAKLPYPTLDARTIRYIWTNDIRVHGKAIFQRIEDGEERHRKQKEREYKNWVEAVGKETQSLFAKDAWTYAT
jgi:hypothetical protein